MITGSLYPTGSTISTGFNSTDEYNLEISTRVSNNNYSDMMGGYYIGWVRPENLPSAMRFSKPHTVNYSLSWSDDYRDLPRFDINVGTPTINADVGYCAAAAFSNTCYYSVYSSEYVRGYTDGTHDPFTSSPISSNLGNAYGVNNIYPEFIGINNLYLCFAFFVFSPTDQYLYSRNDSFTMSYPRYIGFKNGEITLQTNLSSYGSVSFTGSDFENGKAHLTTSINNKVVAIFTGLSVNSSYYRGGSSSLNWGIGVLVHEKNMPSFFGEDIGIENDRFALFNGFGYNASNAPWSLQNLTSGFYYNAGQTIAGSSVPLKLTLGDIYDIPANFATEQFEGYIILKGGGVTSGISIYPYYDIGDVDKFLALFPRTTISNDVPSYGNLNLAPYVTPANEFTVRTHTGSTSDAGFIASLREWQYIDPVDSNPQDNGTKNTNEYDLDDPDDKPEYDPDVPTPEGDVGVNPDNPEANMAGAGDAPEDNVYSPIVGRPLPKAANKFITTYVLTQSQVETVGDVMWADTLESIKNGAAVYGDTGTFNLARLYDLIVSLRFYPFEIPAGYTTSVNGLTMGTGHTVFVEGNVPALDSLAMVVDCGTCKIPATFNGLFPSMKNGDFRNYVNSTITVYLPFCGIVELNPSDVVGYTIALKYHVDLLSGGCTASITLNRENSSFMIANKSGSIGILMPITATNAGQVTANILSDTANVVSTIGSTVMSVLAAKGTMGDINAMRSNPDLSANRSIQLDAQERSTKLGMANKSVGLVTDAMHGAGNLLSRAGCTYSAMGGGYGSSAYTMTVSPFVTIRTSKYASPNNYNHSTGFNSTDYKAIGDFKGFSVFVNPDLTGVDGTAAELGELKAILEHGIFIKK